MTGLTDSQVLEPGLQRRTRVMTQARSYVLDAALVALLTALAFDALSTALVWGLVRHLPV